MGASGQAGERAAGTLFAVSVGPGDPGLVTLAAVRALEACPVWAVVRTPGGATSALDIASCVVDPQAKELVELAFAMTRDTAALSASHDAAAASVCAQLARGCDVAMPILGDASIYSTFHHIRPQVEAAGFATRVIAGVPSFCAVAAALGENLTPQMDAPLHVLPAGYVDIPAALALPGSKVFMKAGSSLGELARAVRASDTSTRAFGAQRCGMPGERLLHDVDELVQADGTYFTTAVVL